MRSDDNAKAVITLRAVVSQMSAETSRGLAIGATVTHLPTDSVAEALHRSATDLSYGVLTYFVDAAHDDLDRDPRRALLLAAAAVRGSRGVAAPAPVLQRLMRGRAWKVYSNALRSHGRLRAADIAADKAIRIFGEVPMLTIERTAALMLKALIVHQLGDTRGRQRSSASVMRSFTDSVSRDARSR